MTEASGQQLLTLGDIARECGVRQHIAKYAIESYGIEPKQRAGILRLWSRDQLQSIKSAIRRIAQRREVIDVAR
jgi:hypothetical protein